MKKFRAHALALAALLCALPATARAFPPGLDPSEFEAIQEEVFAEADANGDGVLSVTEFASFHDLMRERMEASRFAAIDADSSGGVSLAELEAAKPQRGGGRR